MQEIISWILLTQFLGLLGFPICYRLFNKLPDHGYTISKVISISILAYSVWITSSLEVLKTGPYQIILVLMLLVIFEFLWLRSYFFSAPWAWFRNNIKTVVFGELIFAGSFLICAFFVAQSPAIELTEKPMDFMILNSIMLSGISPPPDLWFASTHLNYYYFGHFIMGVLGILSNTAPASTYNLAIIFIFAASATVTYGISYNCIYLFKPKLAYQLSLLPPIAILTLGNQLGILEFIRSLNIYPARLANWIAIENLLPITNKPLSLFPLDHTWWWRSSRIINTFGPNGDNIDYTITEFPLFSFLVGDLHAHLISLPFMLMLFYPVLLLCQSPNNAFQHTRSGLLKPLSIASFLIAISTLINPWNLPVSIILLAVALIYYMNKRHPFAILTIFKVTGLSALILIVVLAIGGPFIINYESTNSSIAINTVLNTRISHMLLVNGTWILGSLVLYYKSFQTIKTRLKTITKYEFIIPFIIALAPLSLWTISVLFSSSWTSIAIIITDKWLISLPMSVLMGMSLFLLFNSSKLSLESKINSFAHVLFSAGYLMLTLGELFYIVDVFNNRMNTVFKFHYQAWILLGVAVTIQLICNAIAEHNRTLSKGRFRTFGIVILTALMFSGPLYYPVALFANHTWNSVAELSLNGEQFLQAYNLTEYQAISWLREQPFQVLAEPYGTDYSTHGRLSSFSGHQSVLSWPGHQIQWRGNAPNIIERQTDIDTLYTTNNTNSLTYIIDKYDIGLITTSPLVKSIYSSYTSSLFDNSLVLLYSNHDYKIYGTVHYEFKEK